MKKKILILGVSGLTEYKITKNASSKYDVHGTYNVRPTKLENCNTFKLDLIQDDQVQKIFVEIKPNIVVNTATLHNVAYCKENKNQTTQVNLKIVKTLSNQIKNIFLK